MTSVMASWMALLSAPNLGGGVRWDSKILLVNPDGSTEYRDMMLDGTIGGRDYGGDDIDDEGSFSLGAGDDDDIFSDAKEDIMEREVDENGVEYFRSAKE